LSIKENHQFEERPFPSDDYGKMVREAEAELIAAYVSGDLTLDKRKSFENHFLRTEERLEKLRLATFLYECVSHGALRVTDLSGSLHRYLLGNLSEEERLQVEGELAAGGDHKQRLEITEHELIVAYTIKILSEDELETVGQYFFSSEEKTERLRFAEELYEYYESAWSAEAREGESTRLLSKFRQWLTMPVHISVGHLNLSRPVWQPLAAASIIGLGALIWTLPFYESPITRGLRALSTAYAQERPFEARLTGFGYATHRAGQNGSMIAPDRRKRDEAFNLINRANQDGTPSTYHALGKIYLTEMNFSDAIRRFETALQGSQADAKLHSDLAVALMERGKAKNPGQSAGEDMASALEHLHRALELDGSLLEARFNLALCHQYQSLWRTAEDDWKSYLENDSQSPWAGEARSNLMKVAEKRKQAGGNRERIHQDFLNAYRARDVEQAWAVYKQSRVVAGSFITDGLIECYLSQALSGKSAEAEDKLAALQFIGNIELERVGDRFTYDLAQFYNGASQRQLRTLSDARGLVASATESLRAAQVGEAIKNYRRAVELFDQTGDVCESLEARRWLGHCYFRQASAALGLPALTQGRQECESRSYLKLLGLYLNDLANVNASLGMYSKALDYGLSQVGYGKRIEDDYGVVLAILRVAEAYTLLGRHQDALPMVQEGLSIASATNIGPEQLVALYFFAYKSHTASGKFAAALDYAKEAFKLSLETDTPWLVSRQHVHLGLAYHKINNDSEAVRLIQESGEIGKRLGDEKMGREIMAFSQLHLGEIYRETGDLDKAAKAYGEALRLYGEGDINIQWPRFEAKKGMLLTHLKGGDDAAVEEELKEVLDLYEQHRNNIEDENSRNNFFDKEQGIYDIAIEYAYFKRRDPRRAFDLSEMSRARSLLDAVNLASGKLLDEKLPTIRLPRSTRPLDLGQLQGRLPGKTQLLQYSLLDKHLVIWVISGADFKGQSVELGGEELDNKVRDYLRSLQKDDYKTRSSELYSLLIKPVEGLLDKDAEICIVPDKALNRLPFASLISPDDGKYLIEKHTILTAPSANMFLVSTDKARQKENVQDERLLSVGNPQFDRATFGNLNDLPGATAQASEISAFYKGSTVLLEKNARESDVRREIERSDVAHFATHYIADERSPMLSLLPLAGEKGPASKENDGMLKTYELYGLKLSRLRLIVFSTCQTGIERYYNGEGTIGLARPFQSAGIPLVVGSLWPVESYTTKELMIAFHKHRKVERISTAKALRQAQLDMIRNSSPELRKPYHWAAYTVIGGHANF
jgi:CHAT domain-containing protein